MKIGMQTWGSHGDVRPFLALAEGLQAAGHEVHLVITCVDSSAYQGMVSEHGVRITSLPTPVFTPEQQGQFARTIYGIRNPMTQMAAILRLIFAPVEDAMFNAARALCQESDVLIGHYFMHPLQIAAEHAGLPYASVLLSHATIPSDYNNPVGLTLFGQAGNRLLWRLTKALLNRTALHYPNRLRRQLGMAPVRDLVTQVWISDDLTLAAVSPQICQAQPDWPASVKVCGFLDTPNLAMEGAVTEGLPASPMTAFLAAGEAPVYMTFGSWTPKDATAQGATLRLLSEAARKAGCRAIIQSQAAAECGFVSDARIMYVAAAPHHAVFPHCRAVVHHGGAGTTQSATLAGKPSIVVAHISEQEHWAVELRRLGIGVRPLHRRKLSAAALARRISRVLASPGMADKAALTGAAMKQEHGVATAVALIEGAFAPGGTDLGARTSILVNAKLAGA